MNCITVPLFLKLMYSVKSLEEEVLGKKQKRKAGSSRSLWMIVEVPRLIYRSGKYLQCTHYTCSGDKERI